MNTAVTVSLHSPNKDVYRAANDCSPCSGKSVWIVLVVIIIITIIIIIIIIMFLLLLVKHRASMKSFQALQSPAIPTDLIL
jgi:heme/copper-type cytochrome/quinol oxidase subunit 2